MKNQRVGGKKQTFLYPIYFLRDLFQFLKKKQVAED